MVTTALMVIGLGGAMLLAKAYPIGGLGRFLTWLRQVNAEIAELEQRRRLLSQPWLEEVMHWGLDGRLHGTETPDPRCRRLSVTTNGWCPGLLRTARGAPDQRQRDA